MTMHKYIVTIHEDGHITADEYEEPKGFVYCSSDAEVVRGSYNEALREVTAILEAEKERCDSNSKIREFGQGWADNWAVRSLECGLLKNVIEKLFRES